METDTMFVTFVPAMVLATAGMQRSVGALTTTAIVTADKLPRVYVLVTTDIAAAERHLVANAITTGIVATNLLQLLAGGTMETTFPIRTDNVLPLIPRP